MKILIIVLISLLLLFSYLNKQHKKNSQFTLEQFFTALLFPCFLFFIFLIYIFVHPLFEIYKYAPIILSILLMICFFGLNFILRFAKINKIGKNELDFGIFIALIAATISFFTLNFTLNNELCFTLAIVSFNLCINHIIPINDIVILSPSEIINKQKARFEKVSKEFKATSVFGLIFIVSFASYPSNNIDTVFCICIGLMTAVIIMHLYKSIKNNCFLPKGLYYLFFFLVFIIAILLFCYSAYNKAINFVNSNDSLPIQDKVKLISELITLFITTTCVSVIIPAVFSIANHFIKLYFDNNDPIHLAAENKQMLEFQVITKEEFNLRQEQIKSLYLKNSNLKKTHK